ncbi:MAG: hypothetical protein K2H09_08790 [Treponemataceae bacterium]|nr:hypothetical protein [Treponemataceae bacterium]
MDSRWFFLLRAYAASAARNFASLASGGVPCVVCGAAAVGIPVCAACRRSFFSVPEPDSSFCRGCGMRLVSERGTCTLCRKNAPAGSADGLYPLFPYRLWCARLVCRWKLHGKRSLSPFFASLVDARLAQLFLKFGDCTVVPVPPRPGKIRRAGWDQVAELCAFLKWRHGRTVGEYLLRRTKAEQKALDRSQRLSSIGKSYVLKPGLEQVPRRLCLVDDVMTTGATIEGCAAALKSRGAETVLAVPLFSVDS